MSNRSIRSFYLPLMEERRIIVISDIHANLSAFQRLLKKVNYQRESDELILLGDLLEKGKENLATLHYIMELSQHPHVHPMIGNCDYVCLNILHNQRLDFLQQILNNREHSIIHEMAAKLSIKIDENTDMLVLAKLLREQYLEELEFVANLPHVIESEHYIFAHAAITNEDTYGRDTRDIMTHEFFMKEDLHFQKYVVVGHLPVSEYCEQIASFMPIIDKDKNIISIDGGNVVKESGQLNAFIIEQTTFQSFYVDDLPTRQVLHDHHAHNEKPLFITWHHSGVEILQAHRYHSYCLHTTTQRALWIPNSFLYRDSLGNVHAANFTTYEHSVKKGDFISLLHQERNRLFVKKDGILGWIPSSCLD